MSRSWGRPISLMAVLPLDVMLTCTVIACVVMILSGSFSIWLTKARGLEPIFVISQARYALAEDYAMTGDLRSIRDTTDHAIAPGRGGQQYINVGAAEIASLASGSGSSRLTLPFRFAVSAGDVPWSSAMLCGQQPLLAGWSTVAASPTTWPNDQLSFACRGAVSR